MFNIPEILAANGFNQLSYRSDEGINGGVTTAMNNGGTSLRPGTRFDSGDPYVIEHSQNDGSNNIVDVADVWQKEIAHVSRKDTQAFVREAGLAWANVQKRYGTSLPVPDAARFSA